MKVVKNMLMKFQIGNFVNVKMPLKVRRRMAGLRNFFPFGNIYQNKKIANSKVVDGVISVLTLSIYALWMLL